MKEERRAANQFADEQHEELRQVIQGRVRRIQARPMASVGTAGDWPTPPRPIIGGRTAEGHDGAPRSPLFGLYRASATHSTRPVRDDSRCFLARPFLAGNQALASWPRHAERRLHASSCITTYYIS